MSRPSMLLIAREGDTLRAVMPPGRNPLYVVGAVGFGIPWLIAIAIGVVYAFRVIPDSRAGLVWIAVLLGTIALTGLLDVVALALVWLAMYAYTGSETLDVTASEIYVRRRGAGITMRAHAKRGHFDRVTRLDTRDAPGRVPHPRVEISGAYSRLRVGAGLTDDEADTLATAVEEFVKEVGPQQVAAQDAVPPSESSSGESLR